MKSKSPPSRQVTDSSLELRLVLVPSNIHHLFAGQHVQSIHAGGPLFQGGEIIATLQPHTSQPMLSIERTKTRRHKFNIVIDADKGRRRREIHMIELRQHVWKQILLEKRSHCYVAPQLPPSPTNEMTRDISNDTNSKNRGQHFGIEWQRTLMLDIAVNVTHCIQKLMEDATELVKKSMPQKAKQVSSMVGDVAGIGDSVTVTTELAKNGMKEIVEVATQ